MLFGSTLSRPWYPNDPTYANRNAMVELNMIDTLGSGIARSFRIQRRRGFTGAANAIETRQGFAWTHSDEFEPDRAFVRIRRG